MQHLLAHSDNHIPWNKGKITGQKPPLKRNEIWAIRVHLHIRQTQSLRFSQVAGA
jgi:hypothetical protein